MPSKEVRDPIHGLIYLEPEEWRVVNSAPFQRLRGVQQLAMTHLVYPGARHSRWEHCVGAGHLAGRVADKLQMDPERRRRVRSAALCHDLGHGPFSHVSEEVFERRTKRKHVHEAISSAIVRTNPDVRQAVGEDMADWVADLLGTTGHGARRSVERDIVAGPSDVDKLDYLLRDSHYCGVKYGEYDLHKIIESVREVVDPTITTESYLGFDYEGLYALEEMLLARYHMHRQVYGHRTRIATDRMLVRAIELGIQEEKLPADVFTPPEDPEEDFIKEYIEWDDAKVVKTLSAADNSAAGDVMRAIVDRHLFKRVIEYDFDALEARFDQPAAGFIANPDEQALQSQLDKAEALLAEALGVDKHWVSLHWTHIVNPISARFSFKVEGEAILLVRGERRLKFNELSEVFSQTELPRQIRVSCYARLPNDKSAKELDDHENAQVEEAMREALTLVAQAVADVGGG